MQHSEFLLPIPQGKWKSGWLLHLRFNWSSSCTLALLRIPAAE